MSKVVERLKALAQLGAYEGGINRPLATAQEKQARELLAQWARESGYALAQDRVGNLFISHGDAMRGGHPEEPKDREAAASGPERKRGVILVGSHLDTVPTGGAYDGAYGVVAALCALEMLDAQHAELAHPVEAVAWVGEEGSRFPLGCLGSSVFSNIVSTDAALKLRDDSGISLHDALSAEETGLLKDVPIRDKAPAVAAYLELHVEQGPILESKGVRLGVVTAITGQRRYVATVIGTSGHAGTVPMQDRSDALCAAAEIILALESAAKDAGGAVVTVGKLHVEPGASNVIPQRVVFSIDSRSPDESKIQKIEDAFHAAAQDVQKSRHVRIVLETGETRRPTPLNDGLRWALHRAASSLGEKALDVASGAGHDAMCLAQIAPAAMLFVPSIGGRSHVREEKTSDEDLELGVRALAAAILEADRTLSS